MEEVCTHEYRVPWEARGIRSLRTRITGVSCLMHDGNPTPLLFKINTNTISPAPRKSFAEALQLAKKNMRAHYHSARHKKSTGEV